MGGNQLKRHPEGRQAAFDQILLCLMLRWECGLQSALSKGGRNPGGSRTLVAYQPGSSVASRRAAGLA